MKASFLSAAPEALFSTGYGSPVSSASLTKKSRLSRICAVGRNEIAGAEQDDVAGNDGLRGDRRLFSVADDAGLKRDGFGKFFGGTVGAVLLDEIEEDAGEHDGVDDDEAGRVSGDGGEDAGDEKNKNERVSEVREEFEDDGAACLPPMMLGPYCARREAASALVRPSLANALLRERVPEEDG